MKKTIIFFIASVLCIGILVGCSRNDELDQNSSIVYSFSGANEYFAVTNGTVILNDEEEVFFGGNLNVTDEGALGNIASYSATFYTMIDGEKHIIMSNSVVDQTGGKISISGDLGEISGEDQIIRNKIGDTLDWENHLYFELATTDLDNEENTYQIQLAVTEVSGAE